MKFILAAVALLATLGLAPPALAVAQYSTMTYYAFVDASQPDDDRADLFGGGNLAGDLATETFVYGDDLGAGSGSGIPGSQYEERDGGMGYGGAPIPVISVTLSIDVSGALVNYTFAPDYYADVYTSGDYDYIDDIAYSTAGDATYAYTEPDFYAPNQLNQSFFSFGYGYGSYFDPAATKTGKLDTIVLDIFAVNVSAVPEPQAWTMMVTGLALTGATARSKRRRTESA
jgi:hypothetical protein